ncbi:hypothetical protein [Corynebacterium sp.]|uniref:hypothetical protein n=1 Tax=Corynebacterium sp. TaxID=1720 RepID=UPI0026DC3963|nr:hypothetical protein [Corynebacterium sp.]MDO4610838.1 hypothetical protein [Corynebacterium sp.]
MTTTFAAPVVDPFTFADYLPLFDYDGPARPAIVDDELVTFDFSAPALASR